MRAKSLTIVLLICLAPLSVKAQQKLTIRQRDGKITSYPVESIRKLTFPSTDLINVATINGTSDSFKISGLWNLSFEINTGYQENISNLTDGITLFPNPTTDILNITLKEELLPEALIEVRTIDGKIIFKTLLREKNVLSVSSLPEGLYFCRVLNGSTVYNSKFIKKD